MPNSENWLDLARKLDWEFSYVREEDVYPEIASGRPWLPHREWADWDEPYRTSYSDYVQTQHRKDASVYAVRDAMGRLDDFRRLDPIWMNALKLYSATFPLAEFAAVIGNLRAGRFGRDSAWRTMATLGALDECRHTQIPLVTMHELVRWDSQFDWTHKFFHTDNWVAIAARHLADEMLLASDPIEFAAATNFVFETGFTNLQFIGLSALAREVGDGLFEKMVQSIQTDEARHAQIGRTVMEKLVRHDRAKAQYLVDKWFWRSWLFFSIVTGFSMDYLTPLEKRTRSFKEFVEEWILEQFVETLGELGLELPWYWSTFLSTLDVYHHRVYATAYTYRATVWFDLVVPSPEERAWLRLKYPRHWESMDAVWDRIVERWQLTDPGVEMGAHGTAIVTFCNLCQLVLSNGTPERNTANVLDYQGERYVFCSEPCRWIFESEPHRYAGHLDVVKRVLAGQAPGNLLEMLTRYFGLTQETWGKDAAGGEYPWLSRARREAT